MEIFNRIVLRQHLQRAENSGTDNFIWRHCGQALQDRLLDIKRGFDKVVEISAAPYVLTPDFLQRKPIAKTLHVKPLQQVDEEFWPYAHHSLNAVIALGNLHWVNDLPGTLLQFKHSLRPDGLFLAAFVGGESLRELRTTLAQVEMELYGGISPRVSPFVTLPDMAALMQRAQFALPVVDNEMITVTYPDLFKMIADLRGMGQTNAIAKQNRKILRRDFWVRANDYYRTHFADQQGRLKATIEIIYALGWAPAASQPQPLPRGSATVELGDFLKKRETQR